MVRKLIGSLVAVTALSFLAAPAQASAALHVVTTVEGLAALAREVGGNRVSVESLSKGVADPHFVDPNPMLAVKLRNADLLVDVGLELEIGWLPPLVNQSRNAGIQPTGPRRLTAASAVQVLDLPTGPVDRSMGDLHPQGNPHFLNDPRRGIADRRRHRGQARRAGPRRCDRIPSQPGRLPQAHRGGDRRLG